MQLNLKPPVIITSRLMAGVRVGGVEISIGYSKRSGREGRVRYEYFLDGPDFNATGDDLQSGAGGGTLQEGLESLLSFLSAAAESKRYARGRSGRGENEDLFPAPVTEWAESYSDEIGGLKYEIEETPGLIFE